MKKLLILSLLFCALFNITAQEKPNKENLLPYVLEKDSVDGWQIFIDENDKLQIVCIIDSIDRFKDEMYNKVVTYFTPPYKDAKSNLEVQDRKAGRVSGNRYLKNYSVSGYEFLNSTTKTNNVYTFSTDMLYQVDVKKKRIRIKLTVERIYVDVEQLPMSAVHMDYSKLPGRSAPLELMEITKNETVISKQLKNSLNTGINIAETKAFKELCDLCVNTIEDVRKIMFGVVENKANTDDW